MYSLISLRLFVLVDIYYRWYTEREISFRVRAFGAVDSVNLHVIKVIYEFFKKTGDHFFE